MVEPVVAGRHGLSACMPLLTLVRRNPIVWAQVVLLALQAQGQVVALVDKAGPLALVATSSQRFSMVTEVVAVSAETQQLPPEAVAEQALLVLVATALQTLVVWQALMAVLPVRLVSHQQPRQLLAAQAALAGNQQTTSLARHQFLAGVVALTAAGSLLPLRINRALQADSPGLPSVTDRRLILQAVTLLSAFAALGAVPVGLQHL
jgi:hypothetical protein